MPQKRKYMPTGGCELIGEFRDHYLKQFGPIEIPSPDLLALECAALYPDNMVILDAGDIWKIIEKWPDAAFHYLYEIRRMFRDKVGPNDRPKLGLIEFYFQSMEYHFMIQSLGREPDNQEIIQALEEWGWSFKDVDGNKLIENARRSQRGKHDKMLKKLIHAMTDGKP